MANIDVFISVGASANQQQELFISALENRLKSEDLIPNTVGRNKFSADSPLKTVIELMKDCSGTIILALERTYFPNGIEKRGGPKEKNILDVKFSTAWNQIEAAMAYAKGQPILVLLEDGITGDGLLEKGYDWYVMNVSLDTAVLNTSEFNGVLSSWKKKVASFNESKGKQKEREINTSELSIGELIRGLKPASLWAMLVALVGLISGSFALGKYWGSLDPVKNGTVSAETKERTELKFRQGIASFFGNQNWLSSTPSVVMGEAKEIVAKLKDDPNTFLNVKQEIERRKKEDANWLFANQLTDALALVNYLGLNNETKDRNDIFLNMVLPEVYQHQVPSK